MTARIRLKHVARIAVSNVDKKSVDGEPPVRLCNYTDVYYNDRITDGLEFMNATASREQIRDFRLAAGDVLITKDSETADDIAVPAFVEGVAPDVVCGYHLALIRPNQQLVEPRFLFWVLASTTAREWFSTQATGVTRFGLRSQAIADAVIRLPALGEQRDTADLLDAETARIDALIQKKQRIIALLEQRRAAVMHAGVSGRFSDWPRCRAGLLWLADRPLHWREAKLTHVARLGSGHTPSRDHPEWWESCTIPWVTTGEVVQMRADRIESITETREKISELGVANSSAEVHPAGTVVLCRTAASAGYSAILGAPMATSQDFATWTCDPELRPRFLLLCLRVMRRDLLERLAMGSTHRTIYMPDVGSIRVPLPPQEEQDSIVDETWARLRRVDATTDAIARQIDLLRERRRALITGAVTGELDFAKGLA